MEETKTCTECGLPLPPTGRGSTRTVCGECLRGRNRKKIKPPVVCIDCHVVFTQANHTGRPPVRCDSCRVERKRQTDAAKAARWRAADPGRQSEYSRRHHDKRKSDPNFRQHKRDNELRRSYGLTREALNEMLDAQDHLCAICGNGHVGPGERLHVDHDHATGKVRALLCGKCNTLIGLADDSPERLELAVAYLRRHIT